MSSGVHLERCRCGCADLSIMIGIFRMISRQRDVNSSAFPYNFHINYFDLIISDVQNV
jgi:hypothetical protein